VKIKQSTLSYITLTSFFLFIIVLQINCTGSSGTDPAKVNSTTPEVYVSTGFPQVVVVSGTEYEMGLQYGQQTAARLAHNVAIQKNQLYGAYGQETVTTDLKVWDYYIKTYTPAMADGCSQEGCNLSYYDILLVSYYPSELWSRPKVPYPAETGVKWAGPRKRPEVAPAERPHSCNAFAATGEATPDGKSILAFDSMVGLEAMDNIILLAFPTTGAPFVTQSPAGKLAGNMGMNGNGFAWAMTAIMNDKPAWGLCEAYFQWLCQTARTPAEAHEFIQSTPRGAVTGGFVMADANNVMVLETNNLHYNLRTPGQEREKGNFVVQTNHLVSTSLQPYNAPFIAFTDSPKRYNTVLRYLTEAKPGTVNFNIGKKIFASDDWYDADTGTWHRNQPGQGGTSNSHGTTSVNIFLPATLTAYLAAGVPSGNGSPAYATGEYVKLQLKGSPKEIAKQADIDTIALYWDAVDTFQYELNTKPAYLTLPVISIIRDTLDKAYYAYSAAMDRYGYAGLEEDQDRKRELLASALTYYAQGQLYAQMAKTDLLRAKFDERETVINK
jgi:hypothetical protein